MGFAQPSVLSEQFLTELRDAEQSIKTLQGLATKHNRRAEEIYNRLLTLAGETAGGSAGNGRHLKDPLSSTLLERYSAVPRQIFDDAIAQVLRFAGSGVGSGPVPIAKRDFRQLQVTLLQELRDVRKVRRQALAGQAHLELAVLSTTHIQIQYDSPTTRALHVLMGQVAVDLAADQPVAISVVADNVQTLGLQDAFRNDVGSEQIAGAIVGVTVQSAGREVLETLDETLEQLTTTWTMLETVDAAARDSNALVEEEKRADFASQRAEEEAHRRRFELSLATVAVVLISPGLVAAVYGATVLDGHAGALGMTLQMGFIALLSALIVALYAAMSDARHQRRTTNGKESFSAASVVLRVPLSSMTVTLSFVCFATVLTLTWTALAGALNTWEQISLTLMMTSTWIIVTLLGPLLTVTDGYTKCPPNADDS